MDDQKIIDLYWSRSETAITETDQKYGKYCYSIAYNILTNNEDAEESVSDTYMVAWKSMPPKRPSILATFLGKITRRLSIDRWRSSTDISGAVVKSSLRWRNWKTAQRTARQLRKPMSESSWP